MKIIVVGTRGFPYIQGGIETHCQGLYPQLVKLGCDVTVIRRKPYITEANNQKEYLGVKFKDTWAPKSKSFEALVHTFFAVIYCRFKSPDIVHFHAIGPSLVVPLARLLGMKVVVTTQGPDYDRQKWNKLAKSMIKLGEYFAVKCSNALIVVSNVINNLIIKHYNYTKSYLIYNGVNMPVKSTDDAYIRSLGLEKNKYIIAVARFVEEKGFDYLIDGYIKTGIANYKLVLVGDADHETAFSQYLKKKAVDNNIVMTGFIKGAQLNEVFSHARLFVLPSFHEGLSLALLEGLSYRLDVLVSDIPANTEVNLSQDSYFKVGNIDDLADKMQNKLITENYTGTFDLTNYRWDNIAQKTYGVYKTVTGKN